MITKKITKDEVIKALEEYFNITKISFMRTNGNEPDGPVTDDFTYIEGEWTGNTRR